MDKMKRLDPIPEEFASYEEAGTFWDTHDTTEYPNIFKTVAPREDRIRALSSYWKNPSVLRLAGQRDPVAVITEKAQDVVFKALELGWSGPPFNPFELAQMLGIKVIPLDNVGSEIDDAQIRLDTSGKFLIEYNPNKPPARIRFSICHEIAHYLFPDCREQVQHRLAHEHISATDRQKEMLCNLGAAELLMPIGSFPEMSKDGYTINNVLELRKKFEVSTEAVLLRMVRLSEEPMAVFGAVANETAAGNPRYTMEYCVTSKAWDAPLYAGLALPENTALKKCIAIGYTTEGSEVWDTKVGRIAVEAVGVSPYPSFTSGKPPAYYLSPRRRASEGVPRVVGLVRPASGQQPAFPRITYLKRDATEPLESTPTLIAHVVNDKTPNWGAGFGRFLAKKWPMVQENFKTAWQERGGLALGATYLTEVSPVISVFHMVAQHGYRHGPKPLIRYEKLRECLQRLADLAVSKHASVQMPKIGAGEAGGSWLVIEEMIEDTLCRRSVAVTVCELPGQKPKEAAQMEMVEQGRTS
jgi:Zn-dependent peptidase ImmA (M78 family)/O-acetyl-ADP-ribose deacetylase (regulator of RNase III)